VVKFGDFAAKHLAETGVEDGVGGGLDAAGEELAE